MVDRLRQSEMMQCNGCNDVMVEEQSEIVQWFRSSVSEKLCNGCNEAMVEGQSE